MKMHSILDDFFFGKGYRIELNEGETEDIIEPYDSTGYQFEAAEVQRCIRAGLQESPECPLDETLAIIRSLDQLVQSWGITYPASTLSDNAPQ